MNTVIVDKFKTIQTRMSSEFKFFFRTDEIFEPLEGFRKLRIIGHIIRFICRLFVMLSLIFLVLGIVAEIFYEDKHYIFILGLISIFHITGSPSGYYSFKTRNKYLLITMFLCNLFWSFSVVIFLVIYLSLCEYH